METRNGTIKLLNKHFKSYRSWQEQIKKKQNLGYNDQTLKLETVTDSKHINQIIK